MKFNKLTYKISGISLANFQNKSGAYIDGAEKDSISRELIMYISRLIVYIYRLIMYQANLVY